MIINNLNDADRRRLVVFNVLKLFFPTKQCMQSIQILDKKFPVSNTFSILGYIDGISGISGISDIISVDNNRVKLNIELTKGLYSSVIPSGTNLLEEMNSFVSEPLPTFPDEESNSTNPVSPTEPNRANSKVLVFEYMLDALFCGIKNIGNQKETKMVNYLVTRIPDLNLKDGPSTSLQLWCNSLGTEMISNVNEEQDMVLIIHEVYLWSCEYLGPIHADKLFANILRKTEELPEASNYSPRNFFE